MSDDEFDPSDGELNEGSETGGVSADFADRVAPDEVRARLDTMLKAVSHQRRRNVLYYLSDHDATTIDTLAERMAAWEAGAPVDDISSDAHEQMKIDLHHTHLPKLTDAGIVEHDPRSGAIRYRQPPEALTRCLRLCQSIEIDE